VVRFEEATDISYSRILSSNFSSALSVEKDVIVDCESEVYDTNDLFDSLSITDRYLEEVIEVFERSGGSEEYWVVEDTAAATTKEATRRSEKKEKTEKTKEEARRNEKTATTNEATRRDKNIEKTEEATRRNDKTATTKEATRRDKNIEKTEEETRRNEKTMTKKDETRRDEITGTARNRKAEIRGGENLQRRTTEKGESACREGIGVVEPESGVTTGLMSDVRNCYLLLLETGERDLFGGGGDWEDGARWMKWESVSRRRGRKRLPEPRISWKEQMKWIREFEEGVARTAGDVGVQGEGMEGNAMEEGNPESDGESQRAFGNTLGFPTHWRLAKSLRIMDRTSSEEEIL